jgi:hypothetical protein
MEPPTAALKRPFVIFDSFVENETGAQIHQDPLRGINAAGLAISRSFDLGGRFLPETPKRGGSLWTRFSLAQSENGKTEIVSTATI